MVSMGFALDELGTCRIFFQNLRQIGRPSPDARFQDLGNFNPAFLMLRGWEGLSTNEE